MRLMKLRELNEENKSKSHGNVARSTSAYGDNKYVWLSCYVLISHLRPTSPENGFIEPQGFFIGVAWQHDVMLT